MEFLNISHLTRLRLKDQAENLSRAIAYSSNTFLGEGLRLICRTYETLNPFSSLNLSLCISGREYIGTLLHFELLKDQSLSKNTQ
jgi:hypothetical protein